MKKGFKKGEGRKIKVTFTPYRLHNKIQMMQTSITSYKIDLHSLYNYDIQHLCFQL
jgi:hypothetical protein